MIGFALFLATAASGHAEPALYRPSAPAIMILAEGEEEVDPDVKPKPKPKRKVVKPKPLAEKLTTPAAPVPYTTPADKAPPPAVTATPIAPAALPAPIELAPPAPPPLPKPVPVMASPTHEVSLRCETLVIYGPKETTRGVFILSLIPSLVNPDEFADLRVMSIDQAHRSIMRETGCFSYMCGLTVTPGYYELTVPNRKKSQLKLTINRQTGAFFAYEQHPESIASGLISLSKRTEVNETGWCVPEVRGKVLF